MLRFVAGMVTGWVAARSLPPTDTHPFTTPSADEIGILANKFRKMTLDIQKYLNENLNDSNSDSKK